MDDQQFDEYHEHYDGHRGNICPRANCDNRMFEMMKEFLGIKDHLQQKRLEWLLGTP